MLGEPWETAGARRCYIYDAQTPVTELSHRGWEAGRGTQGRVREKGQEVMGRKGWERMSRGGGTWEEQGGERRCGHLGEQRGPVAASCASPPPAASLASCTPGLLLTGLLGGGSWHPPGVHKAEEEGGRDGQL